MNYPPPHPEDSRFLRVEPYTAPQRGAPIAFDGGYEPPGISAQPQKPKFALEPFEEITFNGREEWNVKGLLPSWGLAVVYGPSGCGKSFLVTDLALSIAQGKPWADRKVHAGSVCYVAAEGAAGFRKRIAAYRQAHDMGDASPPFFLISAAPNLGTESGDQEQLRASIASARLRAPVRLIVIDTLSQVLHGAEENGAGMMALIGNANALAEHFRCTVLVIHHSGKNVESGSRGHSSLPAAADVVWSVKKNEALGQSIMTVEKAKDEVGGLAFSFQLERRVLATDDDGDEVSSLIVRNIKRAEPATSRKTAGRPKPPRSANLLMACVNEAVSGHGCNIKPFADGPLVRGVSAERVRQVFYDRLADKDQSTKRTAFHRGVNGSIQRQDLFAKEIEGERFLWMP